MKIVSLIENITMCIHNNAMHIIINGFDNKKVVNKIECIFMLTLPRDLCLTLKHDIVNRNFNVQII